MAAGGLLDEFARGALRRLDEEAGPVNCTEHCVTYADNFDFADCTDGCLEGKSSFLATVPYLLGAIVLVCLSGMFSGLTLGLLSLSIEGLDLLVERGLADVEVLLDEVARPPGGENGSAVVSQPSIVL